MDYNTLRRKTREVAVGKVVIGGTAPVSIQTMTSAKAGDLAGTLEQIDAALEAGCDIVRVAVPTLKDIAYFAAVCAESRLPVVADIHFDGRIALAAIEAGAAKLRINPGNMGDWELIYRVLAAAKDAGIPIRIGVNGGSIKHNDKAAVEDLEELVVAEALGYAQRFAEHGFEDIVISAKISEPLATIRVNRKIAAACEYPLHIGVTEAGLEEDAMLKSAVGVGSLLADGIGDTIRLSFTAEPVREVLAAKRLLKAAGLLRAGVEIISCPTCGRCRVEDMPSLVRLVRERVAHIKKPLKLAVMGCEVNGPGEAAEADLGIAGCGSGMLLFARGQKLGNFKREEALKTLLELVEKD